MENGDFVSQYQKLNKAQKEAVDTIEGPVVVIAGPGTGKTQILTLRIANILRKAGAGIGPENILALTFTNAGVVAMRERLASFVGSLTAYKTGIYTFHSFAEMLLREYPEHFRDSFGGRALTELERLQMVEDIVRVGDYSILKTFASDTHHTKALVRAIDTLKQEGITPESFPAILQNQEKEILADESSYYKVNRGKNKKGDLKKDALKPIQKNKELARVFEEYQKMLRQRKCYDFSDLLLVVASVLKKDEELQAILQEQYQYVLVDEHQDTNGVQNQILERLTETESGHSPNLFTVGDDKQAIYRFQGASVENFLHFSTRFPDTKIIDLTENYRSSQTILDVAHRVMTKDATKEHKALLSSGAGEHDHVVVRTFDSYAEELAFVAKDIEEKIDSGVTPEEIAVFYTENKMLAGIREALERRGVRYAVSSKENILEDPLIRKLLWFLRAVANPMNNEYLGEALLMDFVDVNITDALSLFDELRYGKRQKKLFSLMSRAQSLPHLTLHEPEKLVHFAAFIAEQKVAGENMPFSEFFDNFVRKSGFLEGALKSPNGELHLRQLQALLQALRKEMETKPVYRLADFLRYIETLSTYELSIDVQTSASRAGVQLMTAHGSKGLEFEYVYLTNVIHTKWNDKRRINSFRLPVKTVSANLEDERRLFYVALTRAKKGITLTYAKESDDGRAQEKSIFISEMQGEGVLEEQSAGEKHAQEALFKKRVSVHPKLTDLDFIRERFLTTKISATALNNFYTSPVLYFFRNLIRLPSMQTESLLYGNVIHKTLELYFQASQKKGEILPLNIMLIIFDETLEAEFLLREQYGKFEKRGHETLKKYYEEYHQDFTLTIETEKRLKGLTYTLSDGTELGLTGFIDKLEYLPNGTVRVIDYKTGTPWSEQTKEKKERLKRQIVFYKLMLSQYEENGKKFEMTEGVLDFVEANKKGEFERKVITVTDEDIRSLESEIEAFAQSVLSGEFLKGDIPDNKETREYRNLFAVLQESN